MHVNLLWIVPTLVWTFIISVFLLRALLPSATDHKMLGYLNALARPPIDNSVAPFNPNYDLYRQLDLKERPSPDEEKGHVRPSGSRRV